MTRKHTEEQPISCEICEKAAQYEWRVTELETKVEDLRRLLFGTMVSSIGTLIGVIIILIKEYFSRL